MRAAGIKRAQTLIEAAQNSVGLEAGEAARLEIWLLVNDYILKAEQLKRLNEYLEEKVKEVPNVEKLLAIKGVGMSTVIGFIAEVGDIGRFTDPKQIQKLAGLEIVKKGTAKQCTCCLETLVKLHLDNKGKDYIEFEYQKSVQRFNRFLDEVMNMNVWKYIDKYNNIFMQENL